MAKTHGFVGLNPSQNNEDDAILQDFLAEQNVVKFEGAGKTRFTIRPVGPVMVLARHWPKAPKSGKTMPPIWCPKFDLSTQKFDDKRVCPLHDDFNDKAQKVLVFAGIVREWQDGKQKKANPVGVMIVPGSLANDIIEIVVRVQKNDDIADPKKGCDLLFSYDKTAAAAKKWGVQRIERTPLTEEEIEYDVPDLEELSPAFDDTDFCSEYAQALRSKMVRIGYYVKALDNGKDGWDGFKKDPDGEPFSNFPELAGNQKGDDTEPRRRDRDDRDSSSSSDKQPPKRARPVDDDADEEVVEAKEEKPAAKKRPVDDDDDDDDDEADEQPPKPAKKKPAPEPVDEDGDEDEDPPFDADEEEVPAKKPKAAAGKKKPAPVEEDAEDAEDDEEEAPPPAKKVKDDKAGKKADKSGPAEHKAWTADAGVTWISHAKHGHVPDCYGGFLSEPKCKKCPKRADCLGEDN